MSTLGSGIVVSFCDGVYKVSRFQDAYTTSTLGSGVAVSFNDRGS